MEQVGRVMADHKFHEWLDHLEKTIDRIEQAQTPKEKQDAAQALAQSIRRSR
jgi:truncated hemoglobin YjbI